jgi:hypothetical protein
MADAPLVAGEILCRAEAMRFAAAALSWSHDGSWKSFQRPTDVMHRSTFARFTLDLICGSRNFAALRYT